MKKNLILSLLFCISTSQAVFANADHYTSRTIDGKYNNLKNKNWGKSGCPFSRFAQDQYTDKKDGEMPLEHLPNPRTVSNEIFNQKAEVLNDRNLSDIVWQWGQLLDHDMTLFEDSKEEPMPIEVPAGDEIFDKNSQGNVALTFFRSISRIGKRTETRTPVNINTSYIDASTVYGSDETRARVLRDLNNKGLMKVSDGNRLPFNLFGLPNGGGANNKNMYLSGDPRTNEQMGLLTIHTLFVREHNRKAREIAAKNPELTDEEIYRKTRDYVGALTQHITYSEFLPALLGKDAIKPYTGYNSKILPSIRNEFSTFAFRFGHTAVSPTIKRVDNEGKDLGDIVLMESFFKPQLLSSSEEVGYIMKGLASKRMQEIDTEVIDGLRNFLFKDVPNEQMRDLISINLQRSRDHGIADINTLRARFGLKPYTSFSEVTKNKELVAKLQSLYTKVEDVDPFVLVLAEDHLPGTSMGETISKILTEQFTRLRDGDRFYFENKLPAEEVAEIKALKLSDIIKLNTQITNIQDNVFFVN